MKRMIKSATLLDNFNTILKDMCNDVYEAIHKDNFDDVDDTISYTDEDETAVRLFDAVEDVVTKIVQGDIDNFRGTLTRGVNDPSDIDFRCMLTFTLFDADTPKSKFKKISQNIESELLDAGWDYVDCVRYDDAEGYSASDALKPYDVELKIRRNIDLMQM